MWQKRNYADPRYTKARADCRKRDGYRCRWPGCNIRYNLVVHHLRTWAKFPLLRFNVNNMITLCRKHHKMTFKKEEYYLPMFLRILAGQYG